jgi:hypothetical protein
MPGATVELSAASLLDLVSSVRSDGGGDGERRRQPRIGLRARAYVTISDSIIPVWIRDVSSGGMNISCPLELEPGTHLIVALGRTERLVCTVRHSRRISANHFTMGVEFKEPLGAKSTSCAVLNTF